MSTVLALNDRELALLCWLAVGTGVALTDRDMRASLFALVKAAAEPAIIGSIAAFGGYTAALAVLLERVGLWDQSLTTETVVWFVGIGLGLLMNLSRISEQDGWWRRELAKAIRVTVLVEVFVNLAVLSFPLEMVLAPVLFLLTMAWAVADSRRDLRPAKVVAQALLGIIGWGLALYVSFRIASDWKGFTSRHTLQLFALPVLLTVGALPFVYLLGVYSGQSSAYKFTHLATSDPAARRRGRFALLVGLHLRARELGQFRQYEAEQLANAASFREALQIVRRFRAGLGEERRFVHDQEQRLRRYAGVVGSDPEGRQLDRREFAETKEALQYLAMAQSGWYQNPEKRYRDDLLELLRPLAGARPTTASGCSSHRMGNPGGLGDGR